MKPLRWMPLIAGLLLILAPGSAEAVDGTITGLSFSPDPADVNQDVTITVQGTQKCKKVGISFGDNTPDVVIDNPDFDNNNTGDDSVTHAYASAGNYVVTASAVDQCNGSAQKTLTVGSSGGGGGIKPGLLGSKDLLCAILDNCGKMMIVKDPHKLFMLPPHLESIMIFSVFEPGGAVIVSGERFGATKGELHLYLKTDNKDLKLTVNEWADGAIGATIPYATYGVVDQPAEFYVKKADGTESNRKGPVSFTARRALKNLPRSDVKLAFFGCGNASDCDLCMGGGVDEDDWCFASISPNGTVSGYHSQNCGLVGNDVDTDTYSLKASLKNGWVLHQANIHNQVAPGEGTASASLTSNQIKVKWSISPCDGILYYVNVVLRGPIGTDH